MKKLYIIHAGKDADHAETLQAHLALQRRQGLIKFVDDVADADIVACLVSNTTPRSGHSSSARRPAAATRPGCVGWFPY